MYRLLTMKWYDMNLHNLSEVLIIVHLAWNFYKTVITGNLMYLVVIYQLPYVNTSIHHFINGCANVKLSFFVIFAIYIIIPLASNFNILYMYATNVIFNAVVSVIDYLYGHLHDGDIVYVVDTPGG